MVPNYYLTSQSYDESKLGKFPHDPNRTWNPGKMECVWITSPSPDDVTHPERLGNYLGVFDTRHGVNIFGKGDVLVDAIWPDDGDHLGLGRSANGIGVYSAVW